MTTFRFEFPPRRKAQLRLMGDLHTQIANSLEEEWRRRKLTRTQIATILGWDRSALSRKLKSTANITVETLSDLAFAMDRQVMIFFVRPERAQAVRRAVEQICYAGSNPNPFELALRTDAATPKNLDDLLICKNAISEITDHKIAIDQVRKISSATSMNWGPTQWSRSQVEPTVSEVL